MVWDLIGISKCFKINLKRNHDLKLKDRGPALQLVIRRVLFAAVILGKLSYYTQKIIDSLGKSGASRGSPAK